jgi:hypothetical protein
LAWSFLDDGMFLALAVQNSNNNAFSMRLSCVVQYAFVALIAPAILSTLWLYLYPIVQNCHFPAPPSNSNYNGIAPFRLLALGDPQLEGDSSLPDPDALLFPGLVGLGHRLWVEPLDVAARILKRTLTNMQTQRKKLDLLGNDYYLAHIYRTIKWSTQPTHVSALGDLLGSQWISDQEFDRRADRFWKRVFAGAHFWKHDMPDTKEDAESQGQREREFDWDFLDTIKSSQTPALLNVAGNHDIGYAGDINEHRIHRFEQAFGLVNWRIRIPFTNYLDSTNTSTTPLLHLVNLNSMNLDTPAWDEELHHATHKYLDSLIDDTCTRHPHDAVILLTHVPLYKPSGICVDPPFFSYFAPHQGGGIREQNHLSEHSSDKILNGLFTSLNGRERAGIVLNGHDHEGCDTWHTRPEQDAAPWKQTHYPANVSTHGIREVTVRSMMGAYGGNAGLLSAWFNMDTSMWEFEYSTCALGVQHIWWAIHILDLVVVLLGVASSFLWLLRLATRQTVILDTEKKDI